MSDFYSDIVIIGAGASGLMAASGVGASSKMNGKTCRITLLEKMPRPGRKIMITGKGRCNFTNVKSWNEFSGHIHPKPGFLKPSFYNLTSEHIIDFLQAAGMESTVERGDRAFPASHLASDVVDTLVNAATKAGTEILCNKEVKEIDAQTGNDAGLFAIRCCDGSEYTCRKLIICTGGLSYPKTGSTGDGYEWAQTLGHSVKPLFPSLTAVVPRGYKDGNIYRGHIHRGEPLSELGQMLCGNQLKNVGLGLFIDGNEAQNEFGDLDFTDGGIEGPIGFKVSRKCVNAIVNGSRVHVIIDLKPAVEEDDLSVRIATLWNEISKDRRNSQKQYKERFRILLTKVLPTSLVPAFVRCNPNMDHKTLTKALKNWKFEIAGYVGYERCVITAGGVSLEEITPKTLESKLVPGLYFAGEVLDLDADTGGYNLQTAFSTGYLAGMSAGKSLEITPEPSISSESYHTAN